MIFRLILLLISETLVWELNLKTVISSVNSSKRALLRISWWSIFYLDNLREVCFKVISLKKRSF